jgi:hypothetical protein
MITLPASISPFQGDGLCGATTPRGPTYRSVPALGCHIMAFQAGRIAPASCVAMAAHHGAGRRGRMPRLRGTIFARDDQVWKKCGKNVKEKHFY